MCPNILGLKRKGLLVALHSPRLLNVQWLNRWFRSYCVGERERSILGDDVRLICITNRPAFVER